MLFCLSVLGSRCVYLINGTGKYGAHVSEHVAIKNKNKKK